jgi:hypothetical protein
MGYAPPNTLVLRYSNLRFLVSLFAQLVENARVDEIAGLDFARGRICRALLI